MKRYFALLALLISPALATGDPLPEIAVVMPRLAPMTLDHIDRTVTIIGATAFELEPGGPVITVQVGTTSITVPKRLGEGDYNHWWRVKSAYNYHNWTNATGGPPPATGATATSGVTEPISAAWKSGGVTITVVVVQNPGENLLDTYERLKDSVTIGKTVFPPDPEFAYMTPSHRLINERLVA